MQDGHPIHASAHPFSVPPAPLLDPFPASGVSPSPGLMLARNRDRSKGFGFVEMGSPQAAQAAIRGLNGQAVDGRALVVNEARPREERGGFYGNRR